MLAKASADYDLKIGPLTEVEPVDAITTGNLGIDYVTGVGGLPYGRSVELYGPPSSGKTTTALQAAASLQQEIIENGTEEYICYFDHEQALDPAYCEQLGLDLSHPSWLFSQPDSLEQSVDIARKLIDTGQVRMGIWDSVAAMTPEKSLEAESGKVSIALQARMMSEFMKQLNPLIRKNRCTAVFLNHRSEVINMGGPPSRFKTYTTPGGKALKFYASLRIEYVQIKNIMGESEDVLTAETVKRVEATNVKVKVVKNKVATPFKEAIVRVRFGRGFDNGYTALQVLLGHKRIWQPSNDKSRLYFHNAPQLVRDDMPRAAKNDRPYLRGEGAVIALMDRDEAWRLRMIQMAEEVVAEAGMVDAPIDPESEVSEPEPDLESLAK